MRQFIEQFESRTLLSAAPAAFVTDLSQLLADTAALKANFQHNVATLHTDARKLQADFHGLPKNAQNNSLLGHLRGDLGHNFGVMHHDMAAMLKAGTSNVRKLVADGVKVLLHPTDAAAKAKLVADLAAIPVGGGAPVTTFVADLQSFNTSIAADLTALATANPTNTALQSDVGATETDGAAFMTGLGNDFQAVQNDMTKLIGDLPTGA